MSDAEAAMSPPGHVGDDDAEEVDDFEEISELDDVETAGMTEPIEDSEDADDRVGLAEPTPAPEPERSEADLLADDLETDLTGVDEALKRLDDGTYGTCAICGAALEDLHLEENPTVSVCQPACAQPPGAAPAEG